MYNIIGALKNIIKLITLIFFLPFLLFFAILRKSKQQSIIFGCSPILNNKYWANALKLNGHNCLTFMHTYYSINKKDDYDIYFSDVLPSFFKKFTILEKVFTPFFVWVFILRRARVLVTSFNLVSSGYHWKVECLLLKLARIKLVAIPYGSDAFAYSQIKDQSLKYALLASYPALAKKSKEINDRINYVCKVADFIITGIMDYEGFPRTDLLIVSPLVIDTSKWQKKETYSDYNGENGVVNILHCPNHRGFKGSEYIINAVEELKSEGLLVNLILAEGMQNTEVQSLMQKVDILVDQVIAPAYALNAIEGMVSGLPVLANFNNNSYLEVFRRFSFLKECPILSATPETLKDNLRLLAQQPKLRRELGEASRLYVQKYHSYAFFNFWFSKVLDKLKGDNIELVSLFHPLKSEYVKTSPIIHSLINNSIKT